MLEARDITVAFDGRAVLDKASITVGDREVVALQGPSGGGKSTLLRVLAGLLRPDAGRVVLNGRDITHLPPHRRGIGMVFQDDQLFPHLTVEGNVGFGLRMQRTATPTRRARVAEVLALVGLADLGARDVTSLSGGEAKRVALARALAPSPPLLLLDEPLTGLDRDLHDRLVIDLAGLLRQTSTAALLVTHDPDEAAAVADRVLTLADLGTGA